ncbi:MAG: ABC transporter permease [Clostridia bacterium]|nr:ABC transporter permease [Clostridia bacterium]
MRLFFRHLSRSVRKRPLQPIIITVTIVLTIMALVASFGIKNSISEELRLGEESRVGNADFSITATADSKSRFMTAEYVESVLGDGATAVGLYELMFVYGDSEVVMGEAVDFFKAEKIYDFSFLEYEDIHEENLKTTIVITQDLAKKHSLSVGDTLPLTIFGEKIEYRVSAINEKPLFYSCDAMLDIRSVMDIISRKSLFFSALDKDFLPTNSIYVSLDEGMDVDECVEIIRNDPTFEGADVYRVSRMNESKFVTVVLPIILNICIFLVMICGGSIIFSCFYVLSRKRKEENEAFYLAGAKKSMLDFMQIAEVVIYWLVGTPIGLLLSIPMLALMQKYLDFHYATINMTLKSAAFSVGLMLLTAVVTVLLFILIKNGNKKAAKTSKIVLIIISSITAISVLTTLISFGNLRLPSGLTTMVLMMVCLIFVSVPLFLSLVSLTIKRIEKKQKAGKKIKSICLYYALKNAHRVKILGNMVRLVSVLISICTCAILIIGATNGHIKSTAHFFEGDYLVTNANDSCYERLIKSEHKESVYKVFKGSCEYENGFSTMLLSSDSKNAFPKDWEIEKMPEGNQVILSSTDAKMLSAKKGDKITLTIMDMDPAEFEVIDVVTMGTMAIVFDYEHFDLPPSLIMVNANNGEEKELLADITTVAAEEMMTIIEVENFQKHSIERNICLLKCANMLVFIVIFFSLTGFINNLYESYRSRKDEFDLFSYAGMSKKERVKTILWELFLMLFVGCLLGTLASLIITPSLERGLNQIHFELFGYFGYWFK